MGLADGATEVHQITLARQLLKRYKGTDDLFPTMHIPRLFMAIIAISFFWTVGAVLFILFPPLVKNVLTSDKEVASLFLAIFSIGVSIGSIVINRLLKGEVSARYSAPSVIVMSPRTSSPRHSRQTSPTTQPTVQPVPPNRTQ